MPRKEVFHCKDDNSKLGSLSPLDVFLLPCAFLRMSAVYIETLIISDSEL